MLTLRIALLTCAISLGTVAAASAAPITGQISLAGYADPIGANGFGNAKGIDFIQGANGTANPGTPGGLTSFGGGTGSFAGLACANVGGGCGPIQDFLNFDPSTAITSFVALITGGPAVSFDLSSITSETSDPDSAGGLVLLSALGVIHETGFASTPGQLKLTINGSNTESFSATLLAQAPAAVPEPASLALFGSSLAAFGFFRRRRPAKHTPGK